MPSPPPCGRPQRIFPEQHPEHQFKVWPRKCEGFYGRHRGLEAGDQAFDPGKVKGGGFHSPILVCSRSAMRTQSSICEKVSSDGSDRRRWSRKRKSSMLLLVEESGKETHVSTARTRWRAYLRHGCSSGQSRRAIWPEKKRMPSVEEYLSEGWQGAALSMSN